MTDRYHVHSKWSDTYSTVSAYSLTKTHGTNLDDLIAMLDGTYKHMDKITKIEECNVERCNLCATSHLALWLPFRVGEQILETTGAYSDYSVVAIWAVLKEFNPESVKTMAEAQAQGLVAKMEYREWWQG